MKGGIVILIVLIVVAAIVTGTAAGYPYLQAKIVPMIVGAVILLLSVVELIKEFRGRKAAPADPNKLVAEDEEETGDRISVPAYLKEGGWMVGFFLLIYAVGFLVGIGGFTAIYAGTHKTRWSTAVGLGFFMAIISYILFSYAVDTELYPGIIPKFLGLAG